MIPRNLPDYVECGGNQVWRPPYRARGVETFGFVLGCDRRAVDALLRRELVEPAGGAVDYRCAKDWMVVLFTKIESLTSAELPDSQRGYAPELEASIWCLVADVLAGERLVWYLPYVFVDSGSAMVSGREVYGYPKQLGVFGANFPGELESTGTTVQAMAIETYGPEEEATLLPMISAAKLAGTGTDGGEVSFADLRKFFEEDLQVAEDLPHGPDPELSGTITELGEPPSSQSAPGVPAWAVGGVLNTLSGRRLVKNPYDLIEAMVDEPTLVFLKQFHDASCPAKACYQAVVEAPLAIEPVATTAYEALDRSQFQIALHNYDSHPIASELGVPADTPLSPEAAFRASFGFDILLGLEVWRAT